MKRNEISYNAIKNRLQKAKRWRQNGNSFKHRLSPYGTSSPSEYMRGHEVIELKRPGKKNQGFLVLIEILLIMKKFHPEQLFLKVLLRNPTKREFEKEFRSTTQAAEQYLGIYLERDIR